MIDAPQSGDVVRSLRWREEFLARPEWCRPSPERSLRHVPPSRRRSLDRSRHQAESAAVDPPTPPAPSTPPSPSTSTSPAHRRPRRLAVGIAVGQPVAEPVHVVAACACDPTARGTVPRCIRSDLAPLSYACGAGHGHVQGPEGAFGRRDRHIAGRVGQTAGTHSLSRRRDANDGRRRRCGVLAPAGTVTRQPGTTGRAVHCSMWRSRGDTGSTRPQRVTPSRRRGSGCRAPHRLQDPERLGGWLAMTVRRECLRCCGGTPGADRSRR